MNKSFKLLCILNKVYEIVEKMKDFLGLLPSTVRYATATSKLSDPSLALEDCLNKISINMLINVNNRKTRNIPSNSNFRLYILQYISSKWFI